MVKLSLTPNIDITPKQGDHFNVLYQYYDSVAPPPENFIRNSRWTVNRRESSVPSIRRESLVPSIRRESLVPSIRRESLVPSIRESDKIVEVNKDVSSLRDEEVRALNSKLKTYTGSYFEVKYPSNFIAKPTVPIERYNISEDDELNLLDSQTKLLSDSSDFIRTDEAYFSSPDGLVEFFVYSPQWDGRPKNYLDVLKGEKLLSSEHQKDIKAGVHHDYIQTRWVTIQANNGSYTRSYVQQRACHGKYFNDCISHVFGIKYKDKKWYKNYRNFYIAFKESLVQSVD